MEERRVNPLDGVFVLVPPCFNLTSALRLTRSVASALTQLDVKVDPRGT